MDKHTILGVHVKSRAKTAGNIQKILTEFGCSIKTRIGLHDVTPDSCSPSGVILLELVGEDAEIQKLAQKLGAVPGVEAKLMVFEGA
jgi:hypothetical protein